MSDVRIMPGDVIRYDGDGSHDVLIKPGDRAVVDTAYFDPEGDGEVLVCFKASAYRDDKGKLGVAQAIELGITNKGLTIPLPIVSCSGGPGPFVKVADLECVGTTEQNFWRWKDRPRAGGGENFTETVNMWSWKPRPRIKARYTVAELEELPTLSQGQFDNLKIDNGEHRVWLCRCGLEDGAEFEHTVTVEQLVDGRWTLINTYGAEEA